MGNLITFLLSASVCIYFGINYATKELQKITNVFVYYCTLSSVEYFL